jgi:hypothetical protein
MKAFCSCHRPSYILGVHLREKPVRNSLDTSKDFILEITINVPVVYMGRYEVVLRGTIHNSGHFRGWALKIETFLGL